MHRGGALQGARGQTALREVSEMTDNLLYYGDNLDVLRRHVKDETVDLVYLDPPFNSQATYNVLFGERNGRPSSENEARRTMPVGLEARLS